MTEHDTGWILPIEAFEWIENNIEAGSKLLEFGSGHGSNRLTARFELWSVEHDEDWLEITESNYIHAPIVPNEVSTREGEIGWYDPERFDLFPPRVSLIIIDGPPGHIGRSGILAYLDILPQTDYLLIDDVDREPEKSLCTNILKIFDSEVNIIRSVHLRSDGTPREFCILKLIR